MLPVFIAVGLVGCCVIETSPRANALRKDGSYYLRVEWASHPGSNPAKWVGNLIDDDDTLDNGVWEAETTGSANAVLSFFGEKAEVGSFKIMDVGGLLKNPDDAVRKVSVYVTDDIGVTRLGGEKALINKIPWSRVAVIELGKKEGWIELPLEKPVMARYVRIEIVGNPKSQSKTPWLVLGEVKIFPPK